MHLPVLYESYKVIDSVYTIIYPNLDEPEKKHF